MNITKLFPYISLCVTSPISWWNLLQIKIGILNFLGEEVVEPQLVVCHFIAALADSRHAVSSAADRCLKKVLSGVDWNNSVIVSKLYSIFQGTVVVKGQVNEHQLKKLKVLLTWLHRTPTTFLFIAFIVLCGFPLFWINYHSIIIFGLELSLI